MLSLLMRGFRSGGVCCGVRVGGDVTWVGGKLEKELVVGVLEWELLELKEQRFRREQSHSCQISIVHL